MNYKKAYAILIEMAYREENYCMTPNTEVVQALRLGAELLGKEANKLAKAEEIDYGEVE